MKKTLFLPEAEVDLVEGILYYKEFSRRVALEFEIEVIKQLGLIETYPQIGMKKELGLRHFPINRFPNTIIYEEKENEIIIVAIANDCRQPNYWKSRL